MIASRMRQVICIVIRRSDVVVLRTEIGRLKGNLHLSSGVA